VEEMSTDFFITTPFKTIRTIVGTHLIFKDSLEITKIVQDLMTLFKEEKLTFCHLKNNLRKWEKKSTMKHLESYLSIK
jgi:hypothetical protein